PVPTPSTAAWSASSRSGATCAACRRRVPPATSASPAAATASAWPRTSSRSPRNSRPCSTRWTAACAPPGQAAGDKSAAASYARPSGEVTYLAGRIPQPFWEGRSMRRLVMGTLALLVLGPALGARDEPKDKPKGEAPPRSVRDQVQGLIQEYNKGQ